MKSRMTRIAAGLVACTATLFFGSILPSAFAQEPANLPYMNPKLSPEQRAADLVHRMTLAEKASQMYNNSAAVPRLNVPAYQWWSEALHGVIDQDVTEYPEPIGLAATFDAPGIHLMAGQIGIEGRIKHVQDTRAGHKGIGGGLDFWSPNLNIFRDPRWGRGQETYAKILSSPAALGLLTSPECRATTPSTIWRFQHQSTMPCTAGQSQPGTLRMWM